MTKARQLLTQKGEVRLRHGKLRAPTVAYETWGKLSAERDNAILVFTGLSPSAHMASSPADPSPGWWEEMVGAGRPIDTGRYFVICVNSLGSCFGSSGPASIDPDTGERYRLSFPALTIEDIATGGLWVVDHLKIKRLHAVVGASMGGMVSLAFAALYPNRARHLVSISAASHSLPFTISLRSLQREIIREDPAWQGGNYAPDREPINGMRLARKLGMITYRSGKEWQQRFGRRPADPERIPEGFCRYEPFGLDFEVESYLEAVSRKFAGGFDANCYLYLSRAMDLFDLAEHGGSLKQACARMEVDTALIIGVQTDFLFPLHQQHTLSETLIQSGIEVRFEELASIQGHDSFLVDIQRFGPVMESYFASIEAMAG
jgi:homoserine O-acetyltransferase